MPNLDGWEFCRQVREVDDIPILMVTAKGETSQKLKGFDLGSDDYLVKPFEPAELVARVKALLKRSRIANSKIVPLGKLTLDRASGTVSRDGQPIQIPLKEFELLFMLASYQGRTVTREQLLDEIWGYQFDGNERTLDVHINRLRDRFSAGDEGFAIRTIRGLGYRLELI